MGSIEHVPEYPYEPDSCYCKLPWPVYPSHSDRYFWETDYDRGKE